jgi:peptidyl-prolyl cis-trans isomerase SurA
MKLFLLVIAFSLMLVAFKPIEHSVKNNKPSSLHILKKDARKLAEYYRMRVVRGESMSSIAKLYSEDTGSAVNGGLYNNVVRGMMVPEFEKVAFNLKPGEISEVFETFYGFHFIQLLSRKGETLSLRHLLITKE